MRIDYEVSDDPGLLRQYYRLRQHCYRTELNLERFDGSEELADRRGYILIARHGGTCIAGARIVEAGTDELGLLDFGLESANGCIWERLCSSPEFRSKALAMGFCARLVSVSRALGYEYAIMVSTLRNARFYRQIHTALGVGFDIQNKFEAPVMPQFSRFEQYLSVARLQPESTALRLAA